MWEDVRRGADVTAYDVGVEADDALCDRLHHFWRERFLQHPYIGIGRVLDGVHEVLYALERCLQYAIGTVNRLFVNEVSGLQVEDA